MKKIKKMRRLDPSIEKIPIINDETPLRKKSSKVPLQQESFGHGLSHRLLSTGFIPPNFNHVWALDIEGIDSFYFPTDADEMGLNIGAGDIIYVFTEYYAVASGNSPFKIDSRKTLLNSEIPIDYAGNNRTRIYLAIQTGDKQLPRKLNLSHLLKIGTLTGKEKILVAGDDINYETQGAISEDQYLSKGCNLKNIYPPWRGPNQNTSQGYFDQPKRDDGWLLIYKNLSDATARFLSLVYYNEVDAKLRFFLLNVDLPEQVTAYETIVAIEAEIDTKRPILLDGAFFPFHPDSSKWSTAKLLIPNWTKESWVSFDIQMLYPMAGNLQLEDDPIYKDKDTSNFRSIYEDRLSADFNNIGLSISVTPFLKGEISAQLEGVALGEAVQKFGVGEVSNPLLEITKGAYKAAKFGYDNKDVKKKIEDFSKEIENFLEKFSLKTGSFLLSAGTMLGAMAGVGAVVNAIESLFGSDPDPIHLALELQLRGRIEGTVFMSLQTYRQWFYLPGCCNFGQALANGLQCDSGKAIEYRIPYYDSPLGLYGFSKPPFHADFPVSIIPGSIGHNVASVPETLHFPGMDTLPLRERLSQGVTDLSDSEQVGASRLREMLPLIKNSYADFIVFPITDEGSAVNYLEGLGPINQKLVDFGSDLQIRFKQHMDGATFIDLRGNGSSYLVNIMFDDACPILYSGHTTNDFDAGVTLRMLEEDRERNKTIPGSYTQRADLRSGSMEIIVPERPDDFSSGSYLFDSHRDELPSRFPLRFYKVEGMEPVLSVNHNWGLVYRYRSHLSRRVYFRKTAVTSPAVLEVNEIKRGYPKSQSRTILDHTSGVSKNKTFRLTVTQNYGEVPYELVKNPSAMETPVYVDRDYVFTSLPNILRESIYLKTANADKFSQGYDLLTLRCTESYTVYVAFDERFSKVPEWMEDEFTDMRFNFNGDVSLTVKAGNSNSFRLNLYGKRMAKRTPSIVLSGSTIYDFPYLKLGGNLPIGVNANYSMYCLFIKPN